MSDGAERTGPAASTTGLERQIELDLGAANRCDEEGRQAEAWLWLWL